MAHRCSRFLIWGGGGHGKVVADLVRALGHELTGFADRDAAKIGKQVEPGGAQVVLGEAELLAEIRSCRRYPDGVDAVALAIGDNAARHECFARLGELPSPALIHPSAVVSPSARVGPGSVVFARAVINADACLEEAVIVNTGAIVEHDCRLGAAAHVSPGAVLTGGVHVGARSWIGAGATVIPGVRIGADVVVGAGAVVVRNVADRGRVAGVPAKPIRGEPG